MVKKVLSLISQAFTGRGGDTPEGALIVFEQLPPVEFPDAGRTDVETGNIKLQAAIHSALPLFKQCGLHHDSFAEYWHSVYHYDEEADRIHRREVHQKEHCSVCFELARKAYKWIQNELDKTHTMIEDRLVAEEIKGNFTSAFKSAGYTFSRTGQWVRAPGTQVLLER